MIERGRAQRNPLGFVTHRPKFITLTRLIANVATFATYFLAVGLMLEEFGVNLTAYLASASIVGLAISFGSQGLVQDMVIGLTLIFSDVMDVGDMVEIAGAAVVSGRVHEIGLRFTKVVNVFNQVVFIPNRTIANVSRFPHGGLDAYVHIQLPSGIDRPKVVATVEGIAHSMRQQFGTIILSEPVVGKMEGPVVAEQNWDFLCIMFRIWPGQGNLIETVFRQQVVTAIKQLQPDYTDWQVAVTYRPDPSFRKTEASAKHERSK